MHVDAIGKYEGPPCEMCTRTMFVGVCTHRPISRGYRKKISDRMKEVWAERREKKSTE